MTIDKLTYKLFFKVTAQPLIIDTLEWRMSQIIPRVKDSLSKDFIYNSMTLNLDLETCFKITARLLLKGTLWSNYEPDRIKRKYMLRKSDLGRTD